MKDTAQKEGKINLTVYSDGQEIEFAPYLSSVKVVSAFNRIASATITLDDGGATSDGFNICESDVFVPGKQIRISAGYGEEENDIFSGIVVRQSVKLLSGSSKLIVTAKHEAVRMTVSRNSACFYDSSDSDIIKQIAGAYGIHARVDDTEVSHESMLQYHASDWDFVNMRSEANGQILWTSPDGIVSAVPDISADSVLTVDNRFSIMELEAEMDGETACDNFVASTWNYTSSEVEEESVKSGEFDVEQGDLKSSDMSSALGFGDKSLAFDGMQDSVDALSSWAKSAMMRNGLARITGRVKIPGNSGLHLGDMITLDNIGSRFTGKTIVSEIKQEFEDCTWTTEISFGYERNQFADRFNDISQKPASGALPSVNGLQIAIVDKISGDPLEQNRIQVRLLNGEETTLWARVALLDAGDSRGFHFMPEVGDEVVVGFINDNPNLPIVLGMLHSSNKPDPIEADDDNFIKGIYTREKIILEFDDDKKSVLIETPGGNKMIISDDAKGISMEDQNGNKLTMNDQGVTIESAKTLTLKANQDVSIKGTNVTVEANASFKATGNSGAEVSTSAIAVLKGSMVQIN